MVKETTRVVVGAVSLNGNRRERGDIRENSLGIKERQARLSCGGVKSK